MKVHKNPDNGRSLIFSDVKDLSELEILIHYTGTTNAAKAMVLDKTIIPKIINAFNNDDKAKEHARVLRDLIDSSEEWAEFLTPIAAFLEENFTSD